MAAAMQNENSNASRLPHLGGKMRPPLAGGPKLTARPLKDVDQNLNIEKNKKDAFQKQRENAKRLMSGRSVVPVKLADKENSIRLTKDTSSVSLKPANNESSQCLKRVSSLTSLAINKRTVKNNEKPSLLRCESVSSLCQSQQPQTALLKTIQVRQITQSLQNLTIEKTTDFKLEPGVVDIDEKDATDEFYLSYYVKDIYKYLKQLERQYSVRPNYITKQHILTAKMRGLLVDWMFEVKDVFKIQSDSIQISIGLLDRYMQNHPEIEKNKLQLIGVTCIWLGAKYEEIYPPDLESMVSVAANAYTPQEIKTTERKVLNSIDFTMGRPTPCNFLRRYARVAGLNRLSYTFAKYFVDLALVDYSFSYVYPSILGASAVFLAKYVSTNLSEHEIWNASLRYFSQYNFEDIRPSVIKLASVVQEASDSAFKTVPKSYADQKNFFGVSKSHLLASERLRKLAQSDNQTQTKF